jgi:CheY-like chemotaxis protein
MSLKTILLVEDNPSDIGLTKRAFEKSHLVNRLVIVEDGQEALDFLFGTIEQSGHDAAALPAVILLDLQMPSVNGLDVLRRIRADPRTKRLPVVILTTSKEEQDIAESYDLGANSYIHKPVDFVQFSKAIQNLGLYWLVLNEPPPVRINK